MEDLIGKVCLWLVFIAVFCSLKSISLDPFMFCD
jgi:hypothetical protein